MSDNASTIAVAYSKSNSPITNFVEVSRRTDTSNKQISEVFATKIALFGHSLGY